MEPKIHIPIEVQRLDALASMACKKATNPDFKALWYKKMIDLAHKYKLMDYVMKKGLNTNEYILCTQRPCKVSKDVD